jgi:hypothetical protein
MNVEIRRQNIIILFWKKRGRAISFLGIHKSETDSHPLIHRIVCLYFIFSVAYDVCEILSSVDAFTELYYNITALYVKAAAEKKVLLL